MHGPLISTLLLQLAADLVGPNALRSFAFTARSPAIAGDTLHLAARQAGDTLELAALNDAGALLTKASAVTGGG